MEGTKRCEGRFVHDVQAMAAHNAGGLVIVQVERIVEAGSIPPRLVHLPAALVDKARANEGTQAQRRMGAACAVWDN